MAPADFTYYKVLEALDRLRRIDYEPFDKVYTEYRDTLDVWNSHRELYEKDLELVARFYARKYDQPACTQHLYHRTRSQQTKRHSQEM